ncbi:hypothetical protein DPEC_G00027210 [Dallia pectoralis]|uniref:Uncharacterized protein n=1 Tax=Dallia pectoralis TaxID=75939 RepID=A0ACC2HHU9_DALPE|nr:hypothetical protein DPEC_G00027210 [Dallia pectoralis]
MWVEERQSVSCFISLGQNLGRYRSVRSICMHLSSLLHQQEARRLQFPDHTHPQPVCRKKHGRPYSPGNRRCYRRVHAIIIACRLPDNFILESLIDALFFLKTPIAGQIWQQSACLLTRLDLNVRSGG